MWERGIQSSPAVGPAQWDPRAERTNLLYLPIFCGSGFSLHQHLASFFDKMWPLDQLDGTSMPVTSPGSEKPWMPEGCKLAVQQTSQSSNLPLGGGCETGVVGQTNWGRQVATFGS